MRCVALRTGPGVAARGCSLGLQDGGAGDEAAEAAAAPCSAWLGLPPAPLHAAPLLTRFPRPLPHPPQSIPMLVGFWVVLGGFAAVAGFNYVNGTVKDDGTARS
jgi:hypothetical protein